MRPEGVSTRAEVLREPFSARTGTMGVGSGGSSFRGAGRGARLDEEENDSSRMSNAAGTLTMGVGAGGSSRPGGGGTRMTGVDTPESAR
ncbi:hypothetical protein ACLESD_52460 [Pyxidicoccus sp. 3LFB2]